MGIYAFAIALWSMAITLFLTGAMIRIWIRSARVDEYAVMGETRLIARRPKGIARPDA